MFSTMPNTFTSNLRQKSSSLRIVAKATSWGVVTTTAPSGLTFFSALTTVRCSSDVPGGVSVIRKVESGRMSSLYCFNAWSLTRAHSRKQPALVTTTFWNSWGGRLRELQLGTMFCGDVSYMYNRWRTEEEEPTTGTNCISKGGFVKKIWALNFQWPLYPPLSE